jgi:hypothetical protein
MDAAIKGRVLQFTPVPLVAPEEPGGIDREVCVRLSKFIMFRMSPSPELSSPVESLGGPEENEDVMVG